MYTKTLLGLFYVLHIFCHVGAVPVNGQVGNVAALSPDNIDQTMKDAVQTLLAGLIMKGNDLRAELQEEARALLDDPYPFDADTLAEVAKLAQQEVAEATARSGEPTGADDDELDGVADDATADTPLTREATEGNSKRDIAGKSRRSLAEDTLQELERLYTRSEVPVEQHHNRFTDLFHIPMSLSSILGPSDMYPPYGIESPVVQQIPMVASPAVDVIPEASAPIVPVVDAVVPAVDAPVVDMAVAAPVVAPVPEVPVPAAIARSADDDQQNSQDADKN